MKPICLFFYKNKNITELIFGFKSKKEHDILGSPIAQEVIQNPVGNTILWGRN